MINIEEVKTLEFLRKNKNLTQQELADLVEVSRKKIYRWENGRSAPGDIEKEKLCLIFRITDVELNESLELVKDDKIKRPELVQFRATKAVYNKINENAIKANMSISRYVAETYDGGEVIIIEGLKPCTTELRKIGTNLNQLTKSSNEGKVTVLDLKDTKKGLNDIYFKLNHLI